MWIFPKSWVQLLTFEYVVLYLYWKWVGVLVQIFHSSTPWGQNLLIYKKKKLEYQFVTSIFLKIWFSLYTLLQKLTIDWFKRVNKISIDTNLIDRINSCDNTCVSQVTFCLPFNHFDNGLGGRCGMFHYGQTCPCIS